MTARIAGTAAGLVLAAVLLLSWKVPASGSTLGAEAAFTAAPPGELTASPAGSFLRARELRPGADAQTGELDVRNISPRAMDVRVRLLPSGPDLDRGLHVRIEAGDRRLAAGLLGRLHGPSKAVRIGPGRSRTLRFAVNVPSGAGEHSEGRIGNVTVDLRAGVVP
jgi:hypothetical protein